MKSIQNAENTNKEIDISDDIQIGFDLVMAREDFCGTLTEGEASPREVQEAFSEFKERLSQAFFDESYSNRIDNPDVATVAQALVAQVGCLAVLKSGEFEVDEVSEKLEGYLGSSEPRPWQEATISTLIDMVEPYMPSVDLISVK